MKKPVTTVSVARNKKFSILFLSYRDHFICGIWVHYNSTYCEGWRSHNLFQYLVSATSLVKDSAFLIFLPLRSMWKARLHAKLSTENVQNCRNQKQMPMELIQWADINYTPGKTTDFQFWKIHCYTGLNNGNKGQWWAIKQILGNFSKPHVLPLQATSSNLLVSNTFPTALVYWSPDKINRYCYGTMHYSTKMFQHNQITIF